MKFKLDTTEDRYYQVDDRQKEIENLEKLGFKFGEVGKSPFVGPYQRVSYWPTIELNTLEELTSLIEQIGHEVIIIPDPDNIWEIEIYNGYRE